MNIQREEIFLTELTSGTTITFFGTHLGMLGVPEDPTLHAIPTLVELNVLGEPTRVFSFNGKDLWVLNSDVTNHYIPYSASTDTFITGYSYTQELNYIATSNKIEQIKDSYYSTINEALFNAQATTTEDLSNHQEFVFSRYCEIEDFYVNLNINRTFDTLDTLNVYNNLVNSLPAQEADTGVVFGRLVSQQNIKDEKGNNIKIPLRNVPIGIFNPSETFPDSSSVDENGDRLYLNAKESSFEQDYFNINSFSADTENYLRSVSNFTIVPDQYKYITTTNENGEFIIYNAPIGTQMLVFEVDLFKQGLTKDEIALNFFPFPSSTDSFIDNIPSFSFKKIPIDVVSAWGTTQTGYTEVNITTNHDLRKWATFYIPPMSYNERLLGSELSNFSPSLNVDIRDMSKEGFPTTNIPVVEIQNINNKDLDQTLLWSNEFAQIKNGVNFYDHGFKAFKVKANMYDPFGFRTDSEGEPSPYPTSKGVWLAGYQFKLYYNQPRDIFRATGFQIDFGFPSPGWVTRDNFHLNRGNVSASSNSQTPPSNSAPYDRPWNHLYPEKYSIPRKPSQLNYNRTTGAGRLPVSGAKYLEQPEYTDGDLIGLSVENNNPPINLNENSGGYGVQYSSVNSWWFSNRFSKEVTKGYIYKYESRVAWNERYSNAYEPSNPGFLIQPGISQVLGGEKFQRVECGYGYWLRPGGWPPVSVEPFGDAIFSPSTTPGIGLTNTYGPDNMSIGTSNGNVKVGAQDIYIDVYNHEDKDLTIALDSSTTFPQGPLDIYRIIDTSDLLPEGPEVVPTYVRYNFGRTHYQRDVNETDRLVSAIDNSGNGGHDEMFADVSINGQAATNYGLLKIEITNNGNFPVDIPNTSVTIPPGITHEFDAEDLNLDGASIVLPGNSNFDFATSKYLYANYSMRLNNIQFTNTNRSPYSRDILATSQVAAADTPTYYLITTAGPLRTQFNNNNNSCENGSSSASKPGDSLAKWENYVKMDGIFFGVQGTGGGGTVNDLIFQSAPINTASPTYCGGYNYDDGVTSIPIEVV